LNGKTFSIPAKSASGKGSLSPNWQLAVFFNLPIF